ncbi:GNAT family N-acetyltransferase [Telluribacter sp. SYSU D00476]|uniref:GNAT family N-acetyltransferase n=1 Tax=Telluribacter sp. SYSU D00476 TaxID=2811430 RepID=UPI001FF6E5B0|nr:GNAT family N-acetyltransferase [Telluribacter sp. SYSU D00476]
MILHTELRNVVGHWTAPRYEVLLYQTTSPRRNSWFPLEGCQFELYLYNRPDHLGTQATALLYTFYLLDHLTGESLALIHVAQDREAQLWSPPMAPFGGIQCAGHTPPQALAYLLECVAEWAQAQQLKGITIKTAPAAYQPAQHEVLHQSYIAAGYRPLYEHNNHHINVSEQPFVELLAAAERRRLRKCQRAGLVARPWYNPEPELAYHFLEKSRQQQGYPLTLSYRKLRDLLDTFPSEVLVFGVFDGETIAAMTVAIRVSQGVLYNFLPADNLLYRTYSPTVLLNEMLYSYCQSEDIEVLDLGTSLDHHGQPKPGLARFKERLGGTCSPKITYCKEF